MKSLSKTPKPVASQETLRVSSNWHRHRTHSGIIRSQNYLFQRKQVPQFISDHLKDCPDSSFTKVILINAVVLCHQYLTIRPNQSQNLLTMESNNSLSCGYLHTSNQWTACRKWSLSMVNWKYQTKFKNLTLWVHCILVAPQGGIRMQTPGWVLHRQSVK